MPAKISRLTVILKIELLGQTWQQQEKAGICTTAEEKTQNNNKKDN
jgi:hypothetical protein